MEADQEEQIRHNRRAARMEAMRQEKRRQMERRKKIKRLAVLAGPAILAGIVLLIMTFFIRTYGNTKGDDHKNEIAVNKEIEGSVINQTADTEKENLQESPLPDYIVKEDHTKYEFKTTGNTAAIYDEGIISENIILVDEKKDEIIGAKGEKTRISPASMTKVLTILVAAEHLTYEQLEETFTMTLEITDYAYINDCSYVGFLDGEEVKIKDMFYGTILQSGSDAAVGLATYVAGSHEAFVELMNKKLEELGLADTSHVTNCVGLYDENHYSTVYDMAVIMKAAIQNEFCKEVLSCKRYTTMPTAKHPDGIEISNWFLRRIEDKDTGGTVLCAKTGYVMQAKNCAVSYSTYDDGRTYICVTAGSTSSWRCIYDHVDIYNQYTKG